MLSAKRTFNPSFLKAVARPFNTFAPGGLMANETLFENQTHTPKSKLYFIKHPRYREVYPVFTYNFDNSYWKLPCYSFAGLSYVNLMVLYGTFV